MRLERRHARGGGVKHQVNPSDPKLLLLREDLSKEYYAILNVVSNYDGWLLIVKGWSVTLSLAALGLGFQQRHYALFALAAVTGAAFWFLDGLMKGYQYRYYVRMREIEYTAYLINRVTLGGEYGDKEISAPRIDMTWGFKGYPVNKDNEPPPDHDVRAEGLEPSHDKHAEIPTGAPTNLGGGRRRRSTRTCGAASGWRTSCFRTSSQLLSGRRCSSPRHSTLPASSSCICKAVPPRDCPGAAAHTCPASPTSA